jgi:exopolysaccharide production protein ExoZ
MMNSQHNNPRRPFEFFLRRLIRIVPLYYFITCLYCLIYLVEPELFNTFKFSTSWLLASLTFTSGASSFGYPIIVPGWTLEFEILFYAILAITSRLFKNTNQIIALVVILCLLVLYGVNPIILEFLLGVFCAFLSKQLKITYTFAKILVVLGIMTFSISYMIDVSRISRVIVFGIPTFF